MVLTGSRGGKLLQEVVSGHRGCLKQASSTASTDSQPGNRQGSPGYVSYGEKRGRPRHSHFIKVCCTENHRSVDGRNLGRTVGGWGAVGRGGGEVAVYEVQ